MSEDNKNNFDSSELSSKNNVDDVDDDERDDDEEDEPIKEKPHELDSLNKAFNSSLKNKANDGDDNDDDDGNNDGDDGDNEGNESKGNGWQLGSNSKANLSSQEQNLPEQAREVDEFEQNLNNNPNADGENGQRQQTESRSDNNKKSSSLGSILSNFKSNEQYNLRTIGAIALIGGFILAVLFSMSTKEDPKKAKEVASNLPSPEQVKMVESSVDSNELDPVTTKYFPEVESPEPLPTVSIPPVVLPAPGEPVKGDKPVENAKPTEVEEAREFGIELRAGTEKALKTINPAKETTNEKGEEIALDGLTIQMILLEPFRSGISSLVKAQVMADVVNGKGEVLIRANSRVQVPFERFEVDGRVMNDSEQAAQIFLPNGKKLNIRGIVKGIDGFAGIKGRIKKLSKGNVFARMGRTVGRVGARVVGVTTGGFAGRGLEDTINESVDQNTDFIPTGRIVEVLPGTKFTFTPTQP